VNWRSAWNNRDLIGLIRAMPGQNAFSLRRAGAVGVAIVLLISIGWYAFRSRGSAERHNPIVPFRSAEPILDAFKAELPPELREPTPAKWIAWAEREDAAIRARLEQGGRDSMINLLLFGTSFTNQPRTRGLPPADDPLLQARLDDLLKGARNPQDNERLAFVANLLSHHNFNINNPDGYGRAKVFVLENLERVKKEQREFRERLTDATPDNESQNHEHSGVFRDRGIALDTKILSSFGIDAALRDLKNRGKIGAGTVRHVAVVGPGLDFTDKGFGYDFYPLQTLQPFAIYDSVVRLGLGEAGKLDIVAFDISPEVLGFLNRLRQRARDGEPYVVQLPRESRPWVPQMIEYWRSFGSAIGEPVAPIRPPEALKELETRAVRIRPQVVLSCRPVDLNIVLERYDPPAAERFDLVIATNVFVYYDALEQTLALQNISTFLKSGGLFLTNESVSGLPVIPMRALEDVPVQLGQGEFERDLIFCWQRQ
jgi:hypothetical protein